MPLPPDRLWTVAEAVRDTVVDAYATDGVDLPERRFVSDGIPAWDCEQLVVQVERVYRGLVGQEVAGAPVDCLWVRTAVMAVWLIRCTDNKLQGNQTRMVLPSVPQIEGSAQIVLTDAMRLEVALLEAYRDGSLGGCYGIAIDGWEGLGPEGGYSGGLLRVQYQLTEAV